MSKKFARRFASKSQPRKGSGKFIDLTRYPFTQYGKGIVKGNPRRCLICRKPIRRIDAWVKHTSAADSRQGAISVILHADGSKHKPE